MTSSPLEINQSKTSGVRPSTWLPVFGAILVALGLVLYATARYDIGLSPDSVAYIASARNLLSGHGLSIWDGTPITSWPPGYPFILATAAFIFQADPLEMARPVSIAAYAAVLILSMGLVGRYCHERYLRLLTGWLIAASVPLYSVAVMAWSEPMFLVLTIATILLLERYRTHLSWASLVVASVAIAGACLVRYSGVALIAVGTVVVLVGRHTRRAKVLRLAVLGIVSGLPLSLWLLRNYYLTYTLLGERSPSSASLNTHIARLATVITKWFLPDALNHQPALAILSVSALCLGGYCLRTVQSRQRFSRWLSQTSLLWLFLGVYGVFLVVTSTTSAYDPIDDRLASPMFVPLMIAVTSLTALLWAYNGLGWGRLAVTLGLALSLVTAAERLGNASRAHFTRGLGYNSGAWHKSEVLSFVRLNDEVTKHPLFSNGPDVLYIHVGANASRSPLRLSAPSNQMQGTVAGLQCQWPAETSLLVWFRGINREYLLPPDELAAGTVLTRLWSFDDGDIYRVEPACP